MYRAYQKPSAGLVTWVLSHVVISARGISTCREGGIEGGRRIEQLLPEGDDVIVLYGTKHAEVHCQTIVKGLLMQVEFGDVVTQIVVLDGRRRNWLALSMWRFRLHLWGCHRSSC